MPATRAEGSQALIKLPWHEPAPFWHRCLSVPLTTSLPAPRPPRPPRGPPPLRPRSPVAVGGEPWPCPPRSAPLTAPAEAPGAAGAAGSRRGGRRLCGSVAGLKGREGREGGRAAVTWRNKVGEAPTEGSERLGAAPRRAPSAPRELRAAAGATGGVRASGTRSPQPRPEGLRL